MENIQEIADKYVRDQYIDYGDLNEQAEKQIRDAVLFGAEQAHKLSTLNGQSSIWSDNAINRLKAEYFEKGLNAERCSGTQPINNLHTSLDEFKTLVSSIDKDELKSIVSTINKLI